MPARTDERFATKHQRSHAARQRCPGQGRVQRIEMGRRDFVEAMIGVSQPGLAKLLNFLSIGNENQPLSRDQGSEHAGDGRIKANGTRDRRAGAACHFIGIDRPSEII